MKASVILLIFLCGCGWESLGITSVRSHNEHIKQAELNYKDAVKNQANLGGIVRGLALENAIEAKADGDEKKLERAVQAKVRAETAVATSNGLLNSKWDLAPEPAVGFADIIKMLLALLGGGSALGAPFIVGKIMSQSKKLNRVKDKAKKYATSTDKDNYENDPDLTS